MKAHKLLVVPVAIGVAATMFAACGSKANDNNAHPQASLKATSSSINEKARGDLKDGGTLTLAITSLAEVWNPMHVQGNEVDYTNVRLPMSGSFFNFDSESRPVLNKDFAEDVKSETKNGQTVVTFKLNPKAVWGDGTKLSVKDFEATYKACNGADSAFECASTEGYDQVESVKQGASENEVIATFKKTYPDWRAVFNGLMRADSVKDAETFNKGWSELKNDWFSGPFKLEKIDKTAQTVTLVPNDKWWGEKPKLEKLIYKVIDVSAVASAFQNKEIDAFDIGVNADSYQRAKARPDADIRRAAGPNWRHITFNQKAPSLQDKAVRLAIVHYLDRKLVGESDLAGMNWTVKPLNNVIFMSNQEQYRDIAKETGIDFDVAAGDKVLTDAGYKKDGEGIWAKDGKQIAVKFTTLTGVKVSENEGRQFMDQMKKAGIKVELAPVAQNQFSPTLKQRAFEIIAFTWVGANFPYTFPGQIFKPTSSSNYGGYDNPEVNKLLEEISTQVDEKKRADAADQLSQITWKDPQVLPLYQRPDQQACRKDLANWGAFGMQTTVWENIGYTK